MDNSIIGQCSECGGIVSVPIVWYSVNRPVPRCERCHATANIVKNLPIIPMQPKSKLKFG